MVQSLETMKVGGGGSIRVGTTGTISSLMTRELDSMKIPSSSRRKSLDIEPCNSVKKPNKSLNKTIATSTQKLQLLGPQEATRASFEATPVRERRVPTLVEVVDIGCGTSYSSEAGRGWAVPITSRLRKLGFSKLSDHNSNDDASG